MIIKWKARKMGSAELLDTPRRSSRARARATVLKCCHLLRWFMFEFSYWFFRHYGMATQTHKRLYYLRLKMVIPCPRIQRIIHLENFWQGQKILWELSFSTVYRLWHYDHSFLVKFALLSQNPWEKKRRVSISLSEILFLHWFSVKSKQSLFTF